MLPAGNIIGHSEWAPDRKPDIGGAAATIRSKSGTPQQGDWFDMATSADLEAAVRKVLRAEFGADADGNPSLRTAVYDLGARWTNAVLGDNSIDPDTGQRFVIDTPAVGVGSPARKGIDQIIESSAAVQDVKNDLAAMRTDMDAALQNMQVSLNDILTAVRETPTTTT
jgi:hypothetical protein